MVIVSLDVDFCSITILDGLPWYFSIAFCEFTRGFLPWPSASELPELPNPHGAKIQDLGQEFLAGFSPGAPKWRVF